MEQQIKGGHAEVLESALLDGRLVSPDNREFAILCAARQGNKACLDVLLKHNVSVKM